MKKITPIHTFFAILLTLISSLLFPQHTVAQGISVGIAPPLIQIEAVPPASITTPITIENNGETPLTLDIRLRAFTASSQQDGHIAYYPEKDPRSSPEIFEKIQIMEQGHPKTTVTLAPGEKKSLSMHIGIPKKEPLADYYFSVIFISKTDALDPKQTASQTPAGIATNVILSLGPKGPTQGEIAQFKSPWFLTDGPVPFTVKVKNTSDHVIVPRGEILIKNMFNQTIGRVDLVPVNILANTTRTIPDGLPLTNATPSAKAQEALAILHTNWQMKNGTTPVALWPEEFLLGPYTAQLTIALSDQGPVFRRSITFFALPLYILGSIILCIILTAWLILRIRHKLKHPISQNNP